MTAEELVRELSSRQLGYELIPHRRTMTAGDEAAALGVPADEVAKTIVLVAGSGYVRAVLPASERLDLHKVRELLGNGKDARLATETELAGAYPMFELGAVPPFGGPAGDRAILDRRLVEKGTVVIEAGTHSESLRVTAQDLVTVTGAEVADISTE
jgi:Ala-tRNA(Pro) deacylase